MRLRWLALATVTAASVFAAVLGVSSCSSSDSSDATSDGGDAGDVHTLPPLKDAGPDDEPETAPPNCPSTTPVTAADIKPSWGPPPPVQAVCTQQNIDALKAAYAASSTGSVSYKDIRTAIGATCAGCAFSPYVVDGGPATTWSVFLDVDLDAGTAIDNITASCFAELVNPTCGNARHDWEACLRLTCKSTDCGDTNAVAQCKKDVQKGACKDLTATYVAACPNEAALLKYCNIYGSIAAGCAGGPDAGIDASK